MKNLIVQIYIDTKKYGNPNLLPSFDTLSEISFTLARQYAKRIDADYILLTDPYINYIHPTYERFRLFEESKWTDEYDQVLYLDSDVLVYQESPNIFEMYQSPDSFKVCTHWSYTRKNRPNLGGFNAGVFMLNRASRDHMLPYLKYRFDIPLVHHDNSALVNCVENSKVNLEYMDSRFNAKNTGPWFCHTWGSGKRKHPNMECIRLAKEQANNVNR
jgi:alpha-N-acetylglucosamine transferase